MIVPMQPSLIAEPFSDTNWLFEPKWDGYRAICYYGEIRFISRRKPRSHEPVSRLRAINVRADSVIIDGKLVAIDDNGIPCFDELRKSRRSFTIHAITR
jgi:bifunctional non-homologous end joining protein LigD